MNADRDRFSSHIRVRARPLFFTVGRIPYPLSVWLPDLLALLIIAGLGWLAAGKFITSGLFVYGDHPGQFMRMWYALAVSLPQHLRIVDWNPVWYAGYPELQFYPPGHALAGVLLNLVTLGRLSPERVYNLIPVSAMVLPAFTAFVFLRYTLDGLGRWPARLGGLATAFLTLCFTPMWGGTNSVPIGLMGERLAFGLVPLVLLAGWRLVERPSARRLALAGLLLAALVLMHPFHAPAVVLATCIYALARRTIAGIWGLGENTQSPTTFASSPNPGNLVASIGLWAVLAIGLTAWWLVPLLVRQSPYAASLVRTNFSQTLDWLAVDPVPILGVVALPSLALLLYPGIRVRATVAALVLLMPAIALWILFDTTILFGRLTITAFDPIRFIAEYYMALLLLSGAAVAAVVSSWLWHHWPVAASLALLIVVTVQPHAETFVSDLSLWTRYPEGKTADWMLPHPAMAGLWQALRDDPARDGRVLFTSYYMQLAWPGLTVPTDLKAMTPYYTGREIVGGTFSHWSPVARKMWVGDPWARLLPDRVEAEDDRSLFGMSWDQMDGDKLVAELQALNVSTVVAGPDSPNARAWLDKNPVFERYWDNGYFYLYHRRGYQPSWVHASGADTRLVQRDARRWVIQVDRAQPGAALTASMAYYPLWRAEAGGRALALQPDGDALQRLELPAGGPYVVTLTYREGWPEWTGLALTLLALAFAVLGLARGRWRGAAATGAASLPSGR